MTFPSLTHASLHMTLKHAEVTEGEGALVSVEEAKG